MIVDRFVGSKAYGQLLRALLAVIYWCKVQHRGYHVVKPRPSTERKHVPPTASNWVFSCATTAEGNLVIVYCSYTELSYMSAIFFSHSKLIQFTFTCTDQLLKVTLLHTCVMQIWQPNLNIIWILMYKFIYRMEHEKFICLHVIYLKYELNKYK